jgi:hypothetical protein
MSEMCNHLYDRGRTERAISLKDFFFARRIFFSIPLGPWKPKEFPTLSFFYCSVRANQCIERSMAENSAKIFSTYPIRAETSWGGGENQLLAVFHRLSLFIAFALAGGTMTMTKYQNPPPVESIGK